jgi:predicted membrane protein
MKPSEQSHLPTFSAGVALTVSPGAIARGLSLALSLGLFFTLVVFPGIVVRGDALLPRAVLPLLLIGIGGGLAYGLGYRPRSSLLAAMVGPWVSWPLMLSSMAFLVLSSDG